MINYSCPKCQTDLNLGISDFKCNICNFKSDLRDGVISFYDKDIYWGEFSEDKLKKALLLASHGNNLDFVNYIDKELNRYDFVFGKQRSDFMYYLPLTSDASILDIGCGLGAHSFNIAPYVKVVFGLDQSLSRVKFCNERKRINNISNVNFFHGEVTNLPFKDSMFNGVVMNGVVEWLGNIDKYPDPRQDQVQVLKKIFNLLKKDGVLYIGIENRISTAYLTGIDHNGLRFTSFLPRFLASIITKILKGHWYRTYTYSISGYKKLLKDSGFEPEKADFYIAYPGYNLPKYIIPFDDIVSLRYFVSNLACGKKGIKSKLLKAISNNDLALKIVRHFFFSYLIFAKK